MLTLAPNTEKTLTDSIWQKWQNNTHLKITYLEANNLTKFFLKTCRDNQTDYQEYDFANILDSKLNYYENLSLLEEALNPISNSDREAMAKIYQEEVKPELANIQQLEETNLKLEKKLEKKQSVTFNAEMIKAEISQVREKQDQIIAKLEMIPDLDKKIEALQKNQNFQDIAKALEPFKQNKQETPKETKKQFTLPSFQRLKQKIPILDLFATLMVTIIYLCISYAIFTNYTINWLTIAGTASLWITYVIAIRIVAKGILN